jgi:hypothetical protein
MFSHKSNNLRFKAALFFFQRKHIISSPFHNRFRSDRMTWNDKPLSLCLLNGFMGAHPMLVSQFIDRIKKSDILLLTF